MKILLHICCAICATSCIEKLKTEGYEVTGFFYNPNIQPPGEYLKRLHATEEVLSLQDVPLLNGDYELHQWSIQTEGMENLPEGSIRCEKCFYLRLQKTMDIAKEKGFLAFTTTLTVSPHKNAELINRIGLETGGELFLVRDFKKDNGFKRAQELAREHKIYRQNYCGCLCSLNNPKRG